jgi:hypothetical protein
MFVYLILAVACGAVAAQVGAPTPVAIGIGIVGPLVLSTLWLKAGGKDAPTSNLSPGPRTMRFMELLAARYGAVGYEAGAMTATRIKEAFRDGEPDRANMLFVRFSNEVARHPASTRLIDVWQNAWRDSAAGPV